MKGFCFGVALWSVASGLASAEPASDLIVGNVRDQRGAPLAGVRVAALDMAGHDVGDDVTDRAGTFAIRSDGSSATITVACRHCAPVRIERAGRSNIAIVVRRYFALEDSAPDAADLAALPYGRIVDALGLIPYALPSAGGSAISDRGLDGGHGLVLDDGAPVVDLATGTGALVDFPDRYVRTIGVTPPSAAFAYGNDAGGGRFALDQLDGSEGAGSLDAGAVSEIVLEPDFGTLHPSSGESSDAGILERRADVDLATPFAGGFLRTGLASASVSSADNLDPARNLDLAHLSYATASLRYLTFADLSLSGIGAATPAGSAAPSDYRSSYLSADIRVEHPGDVTFTFGLSATQQSASYRVPQPEEYELSGHVAQETLYAQANAGDPRASAQAGLGLTNVTFDESSTTNPRAERLALVPSLSVRAGIGTNAYVRGGYSESTQTPSLVDVALASPDAEAVGIDRGKLIEGALGYDAGRRITGEAIVYRELRAGFDTSRLDGIGASLAWQIAPLVSLRTWTLRDDANAITPAAPNTVPTSRQILWAGYGADERGIRLDLIAHRDVTANHAALGLDGDILVPLVPAYAIDLGTLQQARRTYYFGLRAMQ